MSTLFLDLYLFFVDVRVDTFIVPSYFLLLRIKFSFSNDSMLYSLLVRCFLLVMNSTAFTIILLVSP